jgi:hypothetical protein
MGTNDGQSKESTRPEYIRGKEIYETKEEINFDGL